MLTTSPDVVVVVFFSQTVTKFECISFCYPGQFWPEFLKVFFFSASKLMPDCSIRVGTLYMLLNEKHLIINLV